MIPLYFLSIPGRNKRFCCSYKFKECVTMYISQIWDSIRNDIREYKHSCDTTRNVSVTSEFIMKSYSPSVGQKNSVRGTVNSSRYGTRENNRSATWKLKLRGNQERQWGHAIIIVCARQDEINEEGDSFLRHVHMRDNVLHYNCHKNASFM